MVKTISNFSYSIDNGTVAFFDLSLNGPTEWLWEFGDGNTSNLQNPVHNYNQLGRYEVKLITKNSNGESSEPLIEIIDILGGGIEYISTSILELTNNYTPGIINDLSNIQEKIGLIRKWQLYLQPLITQPQEIEKKDTFNELKYSGLVKNLIAQLVAYDLILEASNAFLLRVTQTDKEEEGEEGETNAKGGQIKSIETGPTKTEWYEDKTGVDKSEAYKNIGSTLTTATKIGGLLDALRASICQLAYRVDIFLPMCPPISNTIPPKVYKRNRKWRS